MGGQTDGVPASLSAWLALRQRADLAARAKSLATLVLTGVAHEGPVQLLDLGTGTGSNIRYLAPLIASRQRWLAVDKDPGLLAEARRRSSGRGVEVETRPIDLNAIDATPELFDGRQLVTASALLDLVSADWLTTVASECRRVGARALFALTYNGRNACTPADPDDVLVFDLFNRHQLTDKGLGGPAAGPHAAEAARQAFLGAGFSVHMEPSDWQIGPSEPEFQRQLIEGWAFAATEVEPGLRQRIDAWTQRRLAHVDAGDSHVIVGHWDIACLPNATR